MTNDFLTNVMLRILRLKKTEKNFSLVFTLLYNFIPAFIFAPYLIMISIQYNLTILLIIGISLFIVDLIHFITAMNKIIKK
ncbi:hypothetical protein HN587_07215 [Candidatus Woesearchaeota archaeon]|jgi:hypothetical protein|nr:hypothetical protein [Candidatus Woesearchaeota archaeon]